MTNGVAWTWKSAGRDEAASCVNLVKTRYRKPVIGGDQQFFQMIVDEMRKSNALHGLDCNSRLRHELQSTKESFPPSP